MKSKSFILVALISILLMYSCKKEEPAKIGEPHENVAKASSYLMGNTIMEKRALIKSILINVEYPNGTNKSFAVDPTNIEAIFWSDRSVSAMLAPFYATTYKEAYREELCFDNEVLNKLNFINNKIVITPQVINQLWTTPGMNDVLPPFIMKAKKCIPQGSPQPDIQ